MFIKRSDTRRIVWHAQSVHSPNNVVVNQDQDYNWYAIQAKPCQEAIAESVVASLDLETFLPRLHHQRFSRGAWRNEVRPLFPGYLFARFRPGHSLHAVRYSRGVCRVVGAGDTPLPVETELISEIRGRMDADGCVRLHEPSWVPGEVVNLQDGPFRGCRGIFERRLDDGHRVEILLQMINNARMVVDERSLEHVTTF